MHAESLARWGRSLVSMKVKLKAYAKLTCCSVAIAYLQSISLAMYCKHKSSYPCTKVKASRLKSLSAWNTAPSWSNICRGTLVLSDNGSAVSMSLIKWRSVLQSWLLTSSITLQRIKYLSKCRLPSIASKEKQPWWVTPMHTFKLCIVCSWVQCRKSSWHFMLNLLTA